MGYTSNSIIAKCKEAFKDKKTFYKQSFINYRGKTEEQKQNAETIRHSAFLF